MMPAHWKTLQVTLVLFLATLVRSAFGFGEAFDLGALTGISDAALSWGGEGDAQAFSDRHYYVLKLL